MARVLLVTTPLIGHCGPLLSIGRALHRAGHRGDVLTGSSRRGLVARTGLGFHALPPAALPFEPVAGPDGRFTPRWVGARRDVIGHFVTPLRAQADALHTVLTEHGRYDVILADTAFLGVLPLLLGACGGARPPVLGLSVTPLSFPSPDAPPFGSGLQRRDTRFARERNRQVRWLLDHGPLRPLQDALDEALAGWQVPPGTVTFFDVVGRFDHTLQFGLPELEYPREALPETVRCVGPVAPLMPAAAPAGWRELRTEADGRPIVHVTQGTVDNQDLGRLVVPAIRALAGADVLTVVTVGRTAGERSVGSAADAVAAEFGAPLPPNVLVADFAAYDQLLPHTDLMITNGGWGGVQQAARYGVPMVVAGATEEKPEVAARVAWAGLGVDLRTGRPGVRRLRRAIGTVLESDRYRRRAQALSATAAARPSAAEEILRTLTATVGDGHPARLEADEAWPRLNRPFTSADGPAVAAADSAGSGRTSGS